MNGHQLAEERCICGHWKATHIFDGAESVCNHDGCKCNAFHLWSVSFYDPSGKKHTMCDVAKFVRDHPELFTDEERQNRFYKRKPGTKNSTSPARACLAETGLSSLTTGIADEWHGWTIAHFPKTYVEPK